MCETRDLGIKWPLWHTLLVSDEIKIDMMLVCPKRCFKKTVHWHKLVFSSEKTIDMQLVCPKDVRKMLVQRARSVHWKKWAGKHEYEEWKDGA